MEIYSYAKEINNRQLLASLLYLSILCIVGLIDFTITSVRPPRPETTVTSCLRAILSYTSNEP